jgi:hypothetical protein
MSVNLFLKSPKTEKSPVIAILRYKGSRFKIYISETVLTSFWNQAKYRVRETSKYPDSYEINARIDAKEERLLAVLQAAKVSGRMPSVEELRASISPVAVTNQLSLVDFATSFIAASNNASATVRRYVTTKNILKQYEETFNTRLTFDIIDLDFYLSLQSYMYSKIKSLNYFGDTIKNIKVFMSEAAERGLHSNMIFRNKKFKVVSETPDSIYLSITELETIAGVQINEETVLKQYGDKITNVKGNVARAIEALSICRDLFLIGAFTALRYSDFSRLLGVGSEAEHITRRNEKTGILTVIPIHPIVREILVRNNGVPPAVSNQKMNKHLKTLGEMAGINQPTESSITAGGRRVRTVNLKYELITTHTARRSACTNMHLQGIPTQSIMAISGHETEESFNKYIRSKQIDTANALKAHPFFATPKIEEI